MTREQFLKFERKLNTLEEARAEMTKLNTVYGLTEARALNSELLGMYSAIALLTGRHYCQWYAEFNSQTNGLAKAESNDQAVGKEKLSSFPEVLDGLQDDEIESLR